MTAAQYRALGHRQVTEAQWQEQVRALCRARRLLHYHTHDSRRSEAGFPDSVVCGPGGVAYLELKTQTGRVSPAQQRWLDGLTAAGETAVVVRPADARALIDLLDRLAQPT